MKLLESCAIEGERPVTENWSTPRDFLSNTMHVKLRMNLRRPRRKPKYSLATDSEQVPRGKDEKDFEKRVKECLKLSGGKRMGAGDAPRSDAKRCEPVRRSTLDVDRCGL